MSHEFNESEVNSIKEFLISYDSGKSADNNSNNISSIQSTEKDGFNANDSIQTPVVMRNKNTTDCCQFGDHIISPNDVESEVFDWLYYHLEYKKCPYELAIALAVIVSRKLGLGATATHETGPESNTDNSKPALPSNELYSQSLEYLTEYINHWKENPEIAIEIAKEYSGKPFLSSVNAIKNSRRKMEDRHIMLHDLNKALNLKVSKQYSYYAIFDGHAGVDAASYSSAHLHHNLVKSQAFLDGDITGAFKEAFSLTDLHYLERSAREGKKSGSTALCALLEQKSKLYIAWLGDSQAILVKNGKPIDVMIPHKPELEEERKRIEELGGFVAYVDTWRVNGTLAVSRAIGDPEHKPYISSEPDVIEITLDSDDDFLILACDGLWDQLTPEEATTLVYQYICENENENTQQVGEKVASYLSKIAKEEGSSDNITTIVLFFKDLSELMATPFTPLTPRDRSLTQELQQNGQMNGINSSNFEFSESQYEMMQTNANPFDSSLANSLSWNTTSPFDDAMNDAKLNFEVSESINSQNTTDSNQTSNPFNEYIEQTPNNNYDNNIGITNDNIVESNAESSELSTESLSREQLINPFETTDKPTNYSNESHFYSHSLTDNSNVTAVQTDSGFICSNISDFSTSFPLSQNNQLDPALCSTPLQPEQQLIVDPFNSIIEDNTVSQTIMDYSNDESGEFCSFRQSGSNSDINGVQNVEQSVQQNIEQTEQIKEVSNQFNSDMEQIATIQSQNEFYDNSHEKSSFETNEWQTAGEESILKNETTLNNESKYDFEDEMTHVIESQEQNFVSLNPSQEFQDLSSGNESSDSIVYEKVNSDLNLVTKTDETDNVLLATDNVTVHNIEKDETHMFISENVESKPDDYSQSKDDIETNFVDNSLESFESKPEQDQILDNVVPEPEVESPQVVDSNPDQCFTSNENSNLFEIEQQITEPELKDDLLNNDIVSKASINLLEAQDMKANESLLSQNIESNSTIIISNTIDLSNTAESSTLGTNESKLADESNENFDSKEVEYTPLENEDSKMMNNLSESVNSKAEELLILDNMVLNSGDNYSLSVESKLEESALSDLVESSPEVPVNTELKPEESLQSENLESKPSEVSSEVLVNEQKEPSVSKNVESKPKDKLPNHSAVSAKTSKTVPSKTLSKTSSSASKPTHTTSASKPIANSKAKPLTSEKPATGPVRPKTTPNSASVSSRPTARTTAPASAPKPSGPPKPSRPLESRVSASRLASAPAKPLATTSRLTTKATDVKVSTAKPLATKTSTAPRTTTAATGKTLGTSTTTRTTTRTTTTTTTSSSSAATKASTSTNSLPRRTATQPTSTLSARPKTSTVTATSKVSAVNGKPASARPQTSTLKSVTSKVDTGRSSTSANKTTTSIKPVTKSSTLQTKTGVKPISVKGENKVSVVPKSNSTATTSNGISSKVAKHNNPLNVPKPLKQELEDADLLSQPNNRSPIETKRGEILSPNESEANFSSPNAADNAFLMSKTGSLGMTPSPDTNGFGSLLDGNESHNLESNMNSSDRNSDLFS